MMGKNNLPVYYRTALPQSTPLSDVTQRKTTYNLAPSCWLDKATVYLRHGQLLSPCALPPTFYLPSPHSRPLPSPSAHLSISSLTDSAWP